MRHVAIYENATVEQFRQEIFPAGLPALLRGYVRHWPAVQHGLESADAAVAYVCRFDSGKPVETLLGPPDIDGRFFYNEKLDGLNFLKRPATVTSTLQRLLSVRGDARPPALYIQSAPIPDLLPGFATAHALPLLDPSVIPRIWIGNSLTVQTHFDLSENIACAVAGHRRFTLFPPEQTPNLYPGPFELTLAGPPVSLVRLEDPDYDRFPRFREALAHALVADLEPGDALYMPYFWWHHVRALDDFNMLVNYWWNDAEPELGSPFDALLHALLAIRDMPERQRKAWQTMFGHYVFAEYGDPVAHLPEAARGALGAHDSRLRQNMRMLLLRSIGRQAGIQPPDTQK